MKKCPFVLAFQFLPLFYLCTLGRSSVNRHCSRAVGLGISLLYFIYAFRSLLTSPPLGNSTNEALVFARRRCPHLSSLFLLYSLFSFLFMPAHVTSGRWRGLVLEKPTIRPISQNSFSCTFTFF